MRERAHFDPLVDNDRATERRSCAIWTATQQGQGNDPWGLPVQTADKLALRKLLFESRFKELTATVEALQAISDRDCRRELVGLDAFGSFYSTDPRLGPLLDAWVAASPESYAPLVARGSRGVRLAGDRRGAKWAAQTREDQWKAMYEAAAVARKDLVASIVMHPTFAARRALMDLNKLTGGAEEPGQSQLALALKQCPASFQMNVKAVVALLPRWGGSYQLIREYVARAPVQQNPKLKVLGGMIDDDLCLLEDDDLKALEHCERALAEGPYWEFLDDKAVLLMRLRRFDEGLAAVDQAVAQRPQNTRLQVHRMVFLRLLKRNEEADKVKALVEQLDPYEPALKRE